MKKKDPENIVEKAQKKGADELELEHMLDMEEPNSTTRPELEHMLKELLQELKASEYGLDTSDILYSRRCRTRVTCILEWMLKHDYVYPTPIKWVRDPSKSKISDTRFYRRAVVPPNDDISVLREAITKLAASIRGSGCQLLPRRLVFYHLDDMPISHDGPPYIHLQNVTSLKQSAFSSMGLRKCVDVASSNDMWGSMARNDVMSVLFPRGFQHLYGSPWTTEGVNRTLYGPGLYDPYFFEDKYVLVCCINVPAPFALRGIQSLFNLCHELSSLERGNVVIVMVARIHIFCDAHQIFNHTFRGLPTSCLVVPYETWELRERMCKQLGFGDEQFKCFVYNTDGSFLNCFCADGYSNPYGAEAFPFTKEMVEKVHRERVALRCGGSLEELLRPSYEDYQPDVVVYVLNQTDGPQRRISQVVENKHVGLYVCCEGNLIPHLHKLYEQCKERNEEFEIVVLYLPLLSNLDPKTFKEYMDGLMQEQQVRGWWCFPFNNSVSLRFWGLTKDYDIGECRFQEELEDRLIIVGPDGKILDMYGAEVIKTHGIDDTYPFTRAAFVEKRMRELRREKRLLESLLGAQLFRGDDPANVISGNALLNKKVIIYMGVALEYDANGIEYDFQRLLSQYEEMKKDVGDEFEVVFVEFAIHHLPGAVDAGVFCEMPWYIHCPLDGTYTALSEQLMDLVAPVQTLVGFGEDGRICSARLLQKLDKTAGLCLEDTLFHDLYIMHQCDEHRVI